MNLPRASENLPLLYIAVIPQFFDVLNQIPSGIVVERGERSASATAALVEEDNPVLLGVVEPSVERV